MAALKHTHLVEQAVHASYNELMDGGCATIRRPARFQFSLLTTHLDAIDATDLLVQACKSKRAEYRKGSNVFRTCSPISLSEVQDVFNKNWRFTCSSFQYWCDKGEERNAFTQKIYRGWDEMVCYNNSYTKDGWT